MNSRTLHFLALSFLGLLFVLFGRGLTYLNVETAVNGVAFNIINTSLALALCGILLMLLINAVVSNSRVSFWESLLNSLVLALVTMLSFYGSIIQIFNWPYNPERTRPDFYENSELTFFLGLGLVLGSLGLWIVFLVSRVRLRPAI